MSVTSLGMLAPRTFSKPDRSFQGETTMISSNGITTGSFTADARPLDVPVPQPAGDGLDGIQTRAVR